MRTKETISADEVGKMEDVLPELRQSAINKKCVGNWRFHCCKCGRFVGKDGFIDVSYDDYIGGYEEGYSLCGACLQKKK